MNVTEGANILNRRLISSLPASVLVVGTNLHHAHRHPWSRCNHPSRMSCTNLCIYIISRCLQFLRRACNGSLYNHPAIAYYTVFTAPCTLHSRHRNLKNIIPLFNTLLKNPLSIKQDLQVRHILKMLHIYKQRLYPFITILQFITGRLQIFHIELIGCCKLNTWTVQNDIIKQYPRTLKYRNPD
jgi:hypothetical protein